MRVGFSSLALALLGMVIVLGCSYERERELGQGVHPNGWAEEGAAGFHGDFLRDENYPLDECQTCHGQDFAGGDVGVSCSDSGACHTQGVDNCEGTCHGSSSSALPSSAAHEVHAAYCQTCHPVPEDLQAPHPDHRIDVEFVGLSARGGRTPQWNPTTQRCSNTYCHLGDSPPWTSQEPLSCEGCHSQSPSHDRFARVVDESTCSECHGGSPAVGHVDGELSISVTRCDACHGSGAATGAPPVALDGSADPASPGLGAHQRHLDSLLPDRIGKVVACRRCHVVPETVLAPGHLDAAAPADVDLVLGSYDPATRSCVVDCHFDREPGPVWNDTSGAERDCDACHAFPPILTRIGTRHPPSPAELDVCVECHLFTPSTHVDGEVSLQ